MHLAWRWDRNVLIKIDHTANKQPERMVKRLPQLGESKEGCICLSVHHPQYVRRLLGVKRKIKIEEKKRIFFSFATTQRLHTVLSTCTADNFSIHRHPLFKVRWKNHTGG